MTFVCFVRHGETDWNKEGKIQGRSDIPLNRAGQEQANLVAQHLKHENWDVLAASPLQRAKKTAETIGASIGLSEIVEMAEFVERAYGDAEGLTKEEREAAFPDQKIPNRETDEELRERGMRGLQILLQQHPGKRILVVAHGGLINAVLSAASKGEIGTGKTRLANTSLSRLVYRENEWHIQDVNVIDHLGVK
ncbi:MAG TPA: histidine phosphatase family protein [Bacillales bacterium]|nr:histidine phosphatase family protein [Bacillales bacterium]